MGTDEQLKGVISIRIDADTEFRLKRLQESEQRRAIGEMARILLVEAIKVREARAKRKRA